VSGETGLWYQCESVKLRQTKDFQAVTSLVIIFARALIQI
jgi:hypothetical protein